MDNHHVNISPSAISCGVLELSRMESDWQRVLYALASYLYHPSRGQPAAFVTWSDTEGSNGWNFYGQATRRFPRSDFIRSRGAENPRTGNIIFVWVWEIPHEELKKWYLEEKVRRIKNG